MDFIINHVCQLDHMHDTNGNFTFKLFTCTTIIQDSFTITLHSCFFHRIEDIILLRSIEYRSCYVDPELHCCHTQVNFQYLTDVHPGRYAQWVKNDLNRCTIRQERHIFFR
eukprot:TRINITY_DN24263_c0_g1_i1.p2 TRINITY_DN24263_c0_g1~~TRINITY_DN24263_c0_g1_i1.p2  ORF type:complete len:111 (-),score=4.93 TRINITY_DN24263_c0_g1_i1:80-412(-)